MRHPELEDVAEQLRMASFLAEVGYRDLSKSANQQRLAVARRLWREGIDERILRMLRHYAESCGNNPVRLFCWWLDRPSRTIEKINEIRAHSEWARRSLDLVTDKMVPMSENIAAIFQMKPRSMGG